MLKKDIPDNHSVPLNEDKKPILLSDDNALIPLNEDKAPVPLNDDTEELTRRLKSLGCNGNNLDSEDEVEDEQEDEVDLEEEEVDVDTMDTQ